MNVTNEWIENVRREVFQQERDAAMQVRGAISVIDALAKLLAEPDPTVNGELEPVEDAGESVTDDDN